MSTKASRETLILVPGLLCDAGVWKHQQAALAERVDIQVAHHGLLDSLGAMAQRILDEAPARFAIAGHSMGGRVALEVMRRAPDRVTALALLDTGCHPLPHGEAGERERSGRYALLEAARREGMRPMGRLWLQNMIHRSRLADQDLVNPILDMMERKTLEIFAAQIHALLTRPDTRPLLPGIACPTLVMCGMEDAWMPYEQHRDIAAAIPASTLVGIGECGHMTPMERPDAVNQAFGRWLDSARSGADDEGR